MRLNWMFLAATPLLAADLFVDEIHPVLAQRCLACHTGPGAQAGLSLENRAAIIKGGKSGTALISGDPSASLILKRIRGSAGMRMPPSGDPLSPKQVAAFERWIADGAVWPDMKAPATSSWSPPLAPRTVPVPEGTATNPIDRFIAAYANKNSVTLPVPVSDARFARRVYYDIWGLPPSPDQLAGFEQSKEPGKRTALIKQLLANSEQYSANWISFWNDLLRNDIGVVYHGDRKSITNWLHASLKANMPYDEMVRQLVNPIGTDQPDGFLVGVNWRGDVNASQLPHIQAAQNTAQIFLGINLKCASCHDSFINKYKLRQAYSLAAMFSEPNRLEIIRCDSKTGQFTEAEFLYPQLGSVPPGASLAERRAAAARLFTHPDNGRLSRTIVNRYWRKLFGRGLVEPVDEMDAEPWNADLLDWLAADFSQHGYDLKYLIELLATSNAYQFPAVTTGEASPSQYTFRGPEPRRLTAEQFLDSVSALTGEWRTLPSGDTARFVREWELKSSALSRAMGRPIRDQVYTTRNEQPTTFQALELVNGQTLTTLLRRGARRMLGELPNPPANKFDSKPVRQGAISFEADITGAQKLWLLTEDAGSYDTEQSVAAWVDVELEGPQGVKKLSDLPTLGKFQVRSVTANKQPLTGMVIPLGNTLVYDISSMGLTKIRGKVAIDDASRASDIIASARFFVFTTEPDRYQLVRTTGEPPSGGVTKPVASRNDALQRLYPTMLGRTAEPAEARALAGETAQPRLEASELEDLIWMLLMHPEFQYLL